MAIKNVIILKLVETYASLASTNPALGNGQEVIVSELASTYLVTNRPKKVGDGSTLFNALYFTDLVEVSTDADYAITQSFIAINNCRVQITNTHVSNIIDITGTSFTLGPLATGNYKRVSGSWLEISNYGQIQPYNAGTPYGLDWIVGYDTKVFISKQAVNTGNTPVGGSGDLWWELWPEAVDVTITDAGGYFAATDVEGALQEKGQLVDQDLKATASPTFVGVSTDTISEKTVSAGTNFPNDLYLNSRKVKFEVTGSIEDSFAPSGTSPHGLAFDGTNLISCDQVTGLIYIHDGISSTILSSFASPGTTPSGLTFDGTNLISCNVGASIIYIHISRLII